MTDPKPTDRADAAKPVRTITDLARIAGVSAGTVSRALSGNSLVNTKTREKIEAIAREHGFRPNQMASRLRRQKTGVIGVAIPLGHDVQQQISDTFFMTLLGFLADELTAKGYDLMLRRVVPSNDEDWLDRFIGSGMIDGVVVIGQSDQFERIEEVADGYLPMVVWGNHQEGQRHCVVGTDNRLGGKLAAERLIAAGATSLAFLGDTDPIEFAARFGGAKEVADKRNVPIRALPTHLSPGQVSSEIAAHLEVIQHEADGVFAATDTIAATCLQEMRTKGIVVPNHVKLVGFDDLPIASQTMPPLTTIKQDIAAGAKGLVDLLLRRMAGEDTESLVLPPHLVARQTA
ncbi:LacI family DNA-binding transcriptional regulator [Erythrobacter litoralis]|uniref:Transcriptional regulator, LacI family protein n=1 Tax=Erythrobacter litoralis (strain HTCC2594) TaxID=314225 RepID=Q2NBJ9_ERYLH|nr:transcriptional regulator, LacI family protein [Erythrobacter litoralis HTCC2594]